MASLISATNLLRVNYWPLIKSRQTLLLALTGVAGYLCQPLSSINMLSFSGLVGNLLVTISGCTVLNMLFDRDIDCKMYRTNRRPLASGQVNPQTAACLGASLVSIGLLWALLISRLYFAVILAGAVINVLVYTLWLKSRSAWSILCGGISGGMPILAGRVLATGRIDTLGVLMAMVIVCWIPSHNLTLNTLHIRDYLNAGVPTFISTYGVAATYIMVSFSSLRVALLIMFVCTQLGISGVILALLFAASLGLVCLGVFVWFNPSQKLVAVMYKYSSFYMLVSILLLSSIGLMR
jgi:protoheme IX farnesyltransferase